MTELTAAQVHTLDQFTAAITAALTAAIEEMRRNAPTPQQLMALASHVAECCATDTELRDRMSIGYIYALARLAAQ